MKKEINQSISNATFNAFWPPMPGQFPLFPFSTVPFWGPATMPMTAGRNCDPEPQRLTGFTSVLDQPSSSNVQGQGAQGQSRDYDASDEDAIQLLDEEEALELVQFNPTVNDGAAWKAGVTIDSFLEKHFSRTISTEERDSIMGDFPRPACAVLQTPKLDEEVKKLIRQAGKDPHFGTEKALYKFQDQILDLTGPLTCLWADLLSKDAKVNVILLLQRVLVLLGSASPRNEGGWLGPVPAQQAPAPHQTIRKKRLHSSGVVFWRKPLKEWSRRKP